MKLQHFLVTRFNCLIGFASRNRGISRWWLTKRFQLFETFCIPSVLAQDTKNFVWILLVDERTPINWLTRLKEAVSRIENGLAILPVPRYSSEVIKEYLQVYIQHSKLNLDAIITTRLDNDDAIPRNFMSNVASVCQECEVGESHVINFVNGCQLHRSGVYRFTPPFLNPFISLMSPIAEVRTVYHMAHERMGEVGRVINIGSTGAKEAPIMWMQVLHSSNVANQLRSNPDRIKIDEERISNFSIGEHPTASACLDEDFKSRKKNRNRTFQKRVRITVGVKGKKN